MALLLTTDTCGCQVEVVYDTPEGTPLGFPFVCPTHQSLVPSALEAGDVVFLYRVIRAEQKAKNLAQGAALEAVSRLRKPGPEVTQAEGVEFSWAFTGPPGRRELTVQFTGVTLTVQEKAAIRSAFSSARLPLAVSLP